MGAFEDGQLPSAERLVSQLIEAIAVPATTAHAQQLFNAYMGRATIRRFANREEDALTDVAAAEAVLADLPETLRSGFRVHTGLMRAKLLSNPHSAAYDPGAADEELVIIRSNGGSGWFVDELESELAFSRQDWEGAAELALSAEQAMRAQGWVQGAAACQRRAGECHLELGEYVVARRELEEAHRFFSLRELPHHLAASQLALARLAHAEGDLEGAWQLALSALETVEGLIRAFRQLPEQQRFLADKLRFYDRALEIGLARGGTEGVLRGWAIAERAKSFHLCQLVANADVSLFEGVDEARLQNLRELDERLDVLERGVAFAQTAVDDEQTNAEFVRVAAERQALLDSLMAENERWAAVRRPPPLDLRSELEGLARDWVPISYFWTSATSGARLNIFFLDPGGTPRNLPVDWSDEELVSLDKLRERLTGTVGVREDVFPSELGDKVLPPQIRASLPTGRAVLISPHEHVVPHAAASGSLRHLPIHALPGDQGRPLIADRPVQYIPTLNLLPVRRAAVPQPGALLLGSVENGFGDPPLRDVDTELADIRSIWAERPDWPLACEVVPADSSPAEVGLALDTWEPYGVIQLACHGHFPEDDPFLAALRLGNDAVRATDFFATRLNASLVALSACSLGRRATRVSAVDVVGDEWVGFVIPLLYAGAERLMASMWDANSRVARVVMTEVHRALCQGEQTAEAYRRGLAAVASKPLPLWANWCLVGIPEVPAPKSQQ